MRPEVLDQAFAILERAAINHVRCPLNDQILGGPKVFSLLARQGRILVEIYRNNFRRVTVLVGPHKGAATISPPGPAAKPFLVVRETGAFRNGKVVDLAANSRRRIAPPPTRRDKADPLERSGGANLHQVKRICFAAGCEATVTDTNFCEAHRYKAPANVGQLTRGRA